MTPLLGKAGQQERSYRALPALTVVSVAVLAAYADGFVLTSLQGAVGATQRADEPFARWLRESTLMVAVYVGVVWLALRLARRWLDGPRWRGLGAVRANALVLALLVVGTTGAAVAESAASALYDYHLQSAQLSAMMSGSHHHGGAVPSALQPSSTVGAVSPEAAAAPVGAVSPEAAAAPAGTSCGAVCAARSATRSAHIRAIVYAAIVFLAVNTVLTAWVWAMRGGELWPQRSARGEVSAMPGPPPGDDEPVPSGRGQLVAAPAR